MRRALLVLLLALTPFSQPAGAARWEPLGPFGGSIRYLTADPADPRVAYAADGLNGLFRTVDSGLHWMPVHGGEVGGAVAVGQGAIYLPVDGRLLRSEDRGIHWLEVTPASRLAPILAAATDPARPSRVYAASQQGVWVSQDRGVTWREPTEPPGATAVLAVPRPAGTVYAATGTGVFRSRDAGLSWERVSQGLPDRTVQALAAASDSSRLYASLGINQLFRSTNAGESWQRIPLPAAGDSVLSLAISPRSADTVFAGTRAHGLWVSTNGGRRWRAASPRPRGVPALAAGPGRTVWAGTSSQRDDVGGVFMSPDDGSSWSRRIQGLAALPAITVAVDPEDSDILWAGTQQGFFRSADAGRTWTRTGFSTPGLPTRDFPVVSIAADSGDPSRVYALTGTGLFRGRDAGISWTEVFGMGVPGPHPAMTRMWADPGVPGKLWGDDRAALVFSTDGGRTWTPAPVSLGCRVWDIAFAPSRPSTVYVAGTKPNNSPCSVTKPGLFRSTDGGATWTEADAGLPDTGAAVTALAVDPIDPLILYAATGGGVWKSTDGGATWAKAGAELAGHPVYAVAASELAGVVWAAPETGPPYRSGDFGATWQVRAAGLQAYAVEEIVIDPNDPHRVYAATSSGVWRWVEE